MSITGGTVTPQLVTVAVRALIALSGRIVLADLSGAVNAHGGSAGFALVS